MNIGKMNIMLDENAIRPTRAHETDAGLDLYTPKAVHLVPRGSAVIDTGVHIELPHGTVGMLKSKSGLNVKKGITSEGVIDEGYAGSICVKLYNNSDDYITLDAGNKVSQLVILPVYIPSELIVVDKFAESERGSNGFGSSGK